MSCLLTADELLSGNIQGGSDNPASRARNRSVNQEIADFLQTPMRWLDIHDAHKRLWLSLSHAFGHHLASFGNRASAKAARPTSPELAFRMPSLATRRHPATLAP